MKIVNTYRGERKIDVEAKLVENNSGEMVAYIDIRPTPVNGVMHFAYVHADGVNATALTAQGHRDANEISDKQKAINLRDQAIRSVMSEGFGDY